MLGQVNAQRAAVGAGPLTLCYQLADAAEAHSADQAGTSTLSHVGSDGSGLGSRANGAGYTRWTALGENVAEGFTDVHAVMVAWMNSPDHRQNILDPRFSAVGFGEATAPRGLWFWTQDFGSTAC
jgi:uncharacterized protein YkwD